MNLTFDDPKSKYTAFLQFRRRLIKVCDSTPVEDSRLFQNCSLMVVHESCSARNANSDGSIFLQIHFSEIATYLQNGLSPKEGKEPKSLSLELNTFSLFLVDTESGVMWIS